MNLQSGFKLLLASAVAVCCVFPADAQSVITEVTGDVQLFQGGWMGNGSEIGKPVTLDFAYDSSALTGSLSNGLYILSAPLTSADIVGGIFGAGINLEPDGPRSGTITDSLDPTTGITTGTVVTSADAPNPGFTGDVFGLSLVTDGTTTTVGLTRNEYSNGLLDSGNSGTVGLSNISVGQVQAPEIDPTSAISALTLLMGGLAVIRGRKLVELQAA
jgi:hypothetical protein